MKLGISSAAFYGVMETEDAAAHLTTLPVDTCEVFVQTWSEYSRDFGLLLRQRLGGLHCTSIHPKSTQYEGDLFSRSPRQTEDAFMLLDRVCQTGEAAGAHYYVMHGFWGIRTVRTPDQIHELVPRMARAQQVAAGHGITILWQNVSWATLRTPAHVAWVRSAMPKQGFVLDVKQCVEAGVSPVDMAKAMGPMLRHVHVLDRNENGFCLPGQGSVDWQGFFSCLKDQGYEGAVILQPYANQARDPEALLRSLDFLRGMLAD